MRCLTCDTENMLDALFCRSCGSRIIQCFSCDAIVENDARFCRRCGTPTGALTESSTAEPPEHDEPIQADASDTTAENEVDFTPEISPAQAEPVPRTRGRVMRAALSVAAIFVAAGLLASVVMLWMNLRALQKHVTVQDEERRVEAEKRRVQDEERIAEQNDMTNHRDQKLTEALRGVSEQSKQLVTRSQEEQRKFVEEQRKSLMAYTDQKAEENRQITAHPRRVARDKTPDKGRQKKGGRKGR